MYSNPPIHGAKIVANIVGDPTLFNEWKAEMEMMAGRIKNVRQKLYDSLSAKDKSGKDWSFILKQIGMFSFTGLNKAQVIASSHTHKISSFPYLIFELQCLICPNSHIDLSCPIASQIQ